MRAAPPCQVDHALHQVVRPLRAFVLDHRFEGIEPLLRFDDIGIVGRLGHDFVELG